MPYSATLLALAMVTAALLNVLTGYLQGAVTVAQLGQLALSFGLFTTMVAALLAARGHLSRLIQTLTALFGASAVLYLVLIFLVALTAMQVPMTVVRTLAYSLLIWSVAIDGFILSSALNAGRLIGFLIALLLFYLQSSLVLLIAGTG
ncbi:MAG: hypothetical protein AAF004_15190 [Pseudomonadota bacterium]